MGNQQLFANNLKFLRNRRGRTQDDVAFTLGMKRSTLSGYENGVSQPNIDILIQFSEYYKMAVDTLLRVDLTKLGELQLQELEAGNDVYIKGRQMRVLATTVNAQNEENIELVPEKAKAGYAAGYADPEFVAQLPLFHLPFLRKDRKYRCFQISGDSMLPIPDGAYITGEYVDDWSSLRNQTPCVLLLKDEGVVFKIVENQLKERGKLILSSLNTYYKPYEVQAEDILECWKFTHFIQQGLPEENTTTATDIRLTLAKLQQEVGSLKEALGK